MAHWECPDCADTFADLTAYCPECGTRTVVDSDFSVPEVTRSGNV